VDARQLFLNNHARAHSSAIPGGGMEDGLCEGLSHKQLRQCPDNRFNSLAWLLWHLARTEDVAVNSVLRDVEEVFDRDDWLERLGVTTRHIGTGDTKEEVRQLSERLDLTALRLYRVAVGQETQSWAAELDFGTLEALVTPEDVRRAQERGAFGEHLMGEFLGWWSGSPRGSLLSWATVGHNLFHMGEAFAVRKMLKAVDS
jgi:hypothetical protein